MTDQPNYPRGPGSPTVKPSEPEREQQALTKVLNQLSDESNRRIIGLPNIRDSLLNVGLDIDKNGFIIRTETGAYATPYAYSPDAFREVESPVDNPFAEYFKPETNVTPCILSKDGRIHLTDLHTTTIIDDTAYPVRDDSMVLRRMHHEVGLAFNTITQWSDARDLINTDDMDGIPVHVNHKALANHELTLNCVRCEFNGPVTDWTEDAVTDTESPPTCPECDGSWLSRGTEHCAECNTTHWWENLNHGGIYGEPSCPECNAGIPALESTTQYDTAHNPIPRE